MGLVIETCTNDSGDCEDQDRWDRALVYSSDPLAMATQRLIGDLIVNRVESFNPNDRNDYMETRLKLMCENKLRCPLFFSFHVRTQQVFCSILCENLNIMYEIFIALPFST